MDRYLTCLILFFVFLGGCLKQIPYDSSQIESFLERPGNIELVFTTEKGRQVAFYIPPVDNPESPPAQLAILYPGIEAVALGWMRFIEKEGNTSTGFLLIDYPGRGLSEGFMRPEENYKNSEGALKALASHFGLEVIGAEINLMGHSFGTGAALQFAARHPVRRVILVAPFNTLRKAVAVKSWILSLMMPSQIDNMQIIKELLVLNNPPEIIILHGTKDKSLPVVMGRELAEIDSERIIFHEFPEDDHVSILTSQRDLIFGKLTGRK